VYPLEGAAPAGLAEEGLQKIHEVIDADGGAGQLDELARPPAFA
jgi:hypothetical protein